MVGTLGGNRHEHREGNQGQLRVTNRQQSGPCAHGPGNDEDYFIRVRHATLPCTLVRMRPKPVDVPDVAIAECAYVTSSTNLVACNAQFNTAWLGLHADRCVAIAQGDLPLLRSGALRSARIPAPDHCVQYRIGRYRPLAKNKTANRLRRWFTAARRAAARMLAARPRSPCLRRRLQP